MLKHTDLSAWTGAPLPSLTAAAQVDGFASKKAGGKYVVYPGMDGHIHMLSATPRTVTKHHDLTTLASSPPLWP